MVNFDTFSVYVLKDPRTNLVHYVGVTNSVKYRYRRHLYDKKTNTEKAAWIAELRQLGLIPVIEVIEDNLFNANEREAYWIGFYRANGMPLKNKTAPTTAKRAGVNP